MESQKHIDQCTDQPPIILGLDISSTAIGFVVLDGTLVRDYGECYLKHDDINERCRLAQAYVAGLLRIHPDIDAAAMETPVNRFAKAMIPQCYVQGAVRSELIKHMPIIDVTPSQAKRALTDRGDADKKSMQAKAADRGVAGEHASDALGVALSAARYVERVFA